MKRLFGLITIFFSPILIFGQLELGSVHSQVNFREGPGLNYKIISSLDSSNLLVILPRKEVNGFVEVFDIESSSHGFVSKLLIHVTDTLKSQKHKLFEKSETNSAGEIEIIMVNKTKNSLFVWINSNSYHLDPLEKKSIITDENNIKYFCSSPGLFPIFGEEILEKSNTYRFDFSL